jgi:hypothetical protein
MKEAKFLLKDASPHFAVDAACGSSEMRAQFAAHRGGAWERRQIKKLCQTCSVVAACREYAARTGSVGVWGAEVISD